LGRKIGHIGILIFVMISLPLSAKKPQKQVALSTEEQQQFTYYWYAARQALTEERYADAYTLLQFCNAIKPNDGQTMAQLGTIYEAIGSKDKAMEAYKAAYEADPENQWQNYLEPLVKQYYQQKEWKKALATQDEIDRRSDSYDAYSAVTRCFIYGEWGKPKKAVKAIDDYLETDPTNLRMLYLRLDFATQMKAKPAELYSLYDRILAIVPNNIMILNNYAWLLATEGKDLKKAEQMSELTIREEPNNPVFLDTYGWIMHLQGQDELAIFYLNKALWNMPDDDEAMKAEVKEHLKKVESEK